MSGVSGLLLIAVAIILFAVVTDTAVAWWETRDIDSKGKLKPDDTDGDSRV